MMADITPIHSPPPSPRPLMGNNKSIVCFVLVALLASTVFSLFIDLKFTVHLPVRLVTKESCETITFAPSSAAASASNVSSSSPTPVPSAAPTMRKERKKKTAMCSIVVNEEIYLDEFVDYHRALGFDKFFIYDNSDGQQMKQWGKLKGDHVEVIPFPGRNKQLPSYIDCGNKLKAAAAEEEEGIEYEWVAFFDIDEFLVLKKHEHVADMLEEHCNRGALVVNWLVFESNGWNVQALEPVTRRFLYHLPVEHPVNKHVKTIARVRDIKEIIHGDPHNFVELKEEEEKSGLRIHFFLREEEEEGSGSITVHDSNGKQVIGPFNDNKPTDVVVIHHYHTKSSKEYLLKRMRGRSDIDPTIQEHAGIEEEALQTAKQLFSNALQGDNLPLDADDLSKNQHLVFDDSAWQFLKKHVPGYELFDEIALLPANDNGT